MMTHKFRTYGQNMNDFTLDRFDHAILNALISDSTATNAQLSEIAKLSASQCSRRR
ncbi:MAG: AsnC family transcriptional regulator, partial [Salaquimonas sp.]